MIPNTTGTLAQQRLSSSIESKAVKLKPQGEAEIGVKADITKYAVSIPIYNGDKRIIGYQAEGKNHHLFESYRGCNENHYIQFVSTGTVALSFDLKRSLDGVSWETVSTTAVPAGTSKIITAPTCDNMWYLITQTVATAGSTYYVNAR